MNFLSILSLILVCAKLFAHAQISWLVCLAPFLVGVVILILAIILRTIVEVLW